MCNGSPYGSYYGGRAVNNPAAGYYGMYRRRVIAVAGYYGRLPLVIARPRRATDLTGQAALAGIDASASARLDRV